MAVGLILSITEAINLILPFLYTKAGISAADASGKGSKQVVWITWILGLVVLSSYILLPSQSVALVFVASITLLIFASMFLAGSNEAAFCNMIASSFGFVYGALPWLSIWYLYRSGSGAANLIFLLVLVWGSDTGGYFGGRLFGKNKLAPRISPKKTREGAVAALLTSLIGGILIKQYYGMEVSYMGWIAVIAIVGGVATQLGDLVESAIKRVVGVKDSGKLLPGHGGFLDRVDGLLMAAPIVALMLQLMSS
jgi:phosphatidate cytidylyltransferase